jgi:hypothetical protein
MRASRLITCLVTLIVLISAAPAPLFAATATLNPVKDNTLYEPITKDNLEDRSNALGKNMFVGRVKDAVNASGQVAVRRAVLAFDIAGAIPAGATIESVTLTLVVNRVPGNTNHDVGLHRLLADWGEGTSNTGNSQQGRGEDPTTGDATWKHTFCVNADSDGFCDPSSQFWATPGGVYTLTPSARDGRRRASLARQSVAELRLDRHR